MAKVLILGCGKLGYPLALNLIDDRHDVTGIRRSPPNHEPSALNWTALDITNSESLKVLPTDVELVVIILTPSSRSPEGYESIYQTGLSRVLARFQFRAKIPAVVFVSATSVYGQDHGEWVDENSTADPNTYNGKSLLMAEQAIHRFNPAAVVVRFSGIYGNQRRRLLDSLQQAQEIQQQPPLYTNRIHEQDCVGVLALIARRLLNGVHTPRLLVATDHDPAPKYEMMRWLATEAGLITPTPVQTPSVTRQNKRASNQRLLDIGYRFLFPTYREGYRAILNG